EAARLALRRGDGSHDLAGRRIIISAGGTREAVDPVRFIGNHSSGKQGYALARTAAARGAEVTLIAANVSLPDPAGVEVVSVTSGVELDDAVPERRSGADAVVRSAAVADFRPSNSVASQTKKSGGEPAPIELTENPDILAELVRTRPARAPGQTVVGFAA